MSSSRSATKARSIPKLFHLVDARNWASVQRHGLLSAARLAALSGLTTFQNLRRHREADEVLPSGVVLRDQKPMPPAALRRCLVGEMTPEDWYDLLNSKVFFWLDNARLLRHRNAYGDADQLVLTIDAKRLLGRYGDVAFVSPINTGNARRAAAPRNSSTFVPYDRWLHDGWAFERLPGRASRPANHRPVELTISDGVPDILTYVTDVAALKRD